MINGRLYVYMGWLWTYRYFFRYNPATNAWTKLPTPSWAHASGAAGVIGGRFYLFGGSEDYATHGVIEAYDPATNKWTTKAELSDWSRWREGAGSAVINGKLYVAGGSAPVSPFIMKTLLVYDPATNQVSTKASMATAREFPAGVAAGGKLFVIGGHNGSVLCKVEAYTP